MLTAEARARLMQALEAADKAALPGFPTGPMSERWLEALLPELAEQGFELVDEAVPYDDRARQIADAGVRLLRDHEARQHAGERCPVETINFLAFLAHSFGVHIAPDAEGAEDAIRQFLERVRDYGAIHEEHVEEEVER